jgi:serine protease AprX
VSPLLLDTKHGCVTRSSKSPKLQASDPEKKPFDPEVLDRTVIAIPLLRDLAENPDKIYDVIIDLNLGYHGGRQAAEDRVKELLHEAVAKGGKKKRGASAVDEEKSRLTNQYLFATLEGKLIRELVRLDGNPNKKAGDAPQTQRAIYRIWPDFPVSPLITKSISTVKADAAGNAFAAFGEGIVWAVMDSGIDKQHSHFEQERNLDLTDPLEHKDFTSSAGSTGALTDDFGHGTHVAGIIAGRAGSQGKDNVPLFAAARHRDETGNISVDTIEIKRISGMAPSCKLLSLKVLDASGQGKASNLIAAIAYIQEMNGHGRTFRIHGVNMSVGYDFEPEWFACGQSPLCVEVDRLVKSGVVVVVAAGNTGYGFNATQARGAVASGLDLTINDPGNAELAITVGSTHRDMPHVYGVSYFSSKGPTGDGRQKPDLVAPGEKILSCATPRPLAKMKAKLDANKTYSYVEDSGTSMAAPHVSGVIAAFLSIRGEFIGQSEKVKEIFLATATDLKRDAYFQGRGLVDLMRAIQSV